MEDSSLSLYLEFAKRNLAIVAIITDVLREEKRNSVADFSDLTRNFPKVRSRHFVGRTVNVHLATTNTTDQLRKSQGIFFNS